MEWLAKGVTARRKREEKENFYNFKEEFESQEKRFFEVNF